MSDTPETDKEWRHPASFDGGERVVHISFTQKMERERDEARDEWGKASMDAAQLLSEKTKVMKERDEARSMTEHQWLLRVGSRLCVAGCKSDGILDSIDEIIRERDETRGAIKSTIAWLQSRRNAPDFTTMGMVEERLRRALEAAK